MASETMTCNCPIVARYNHETGDYEMQEHTRECDTRPAPEYAGLVERLAGMEPLDTAPRDRTHILAKTLPRDDQWSNYGGRWFVVWHIDKVSGWSLFPGMGVGDDWFEGWTHLPLAAATALTALTERNKALEAEVAALREIVVDGLKFAKLVKDDGIWSEGVHTGLRKGTDGPSGGKIWCAITYSKDSAWSDAIKFAIDPFFSMWGGDKFIANATAALGDRP